MTKISEINHLKKKFVLAQNIIKDLSQWWWGRHGSDEVWGRLLSMVNQRVERMGPDAGAKPDLESP